MGLIDKNYISAYELALRDRFRDLPLSDFPPSDIEKEDISKYNLISNTGEDSLCPLERNHRYEESTHSRIFRNQS